MHWFEKRWLVERIVVDGESVQRVATAFGITVPTARNIIKEITGTPHVLAARHNYWSRNVTNIGIS